MKTNRHPLYENRRFCMFFFTLSRPFQIIRKTYGADVYFMVERGPKFLELCGDFGDSFYKHRTPLVSSVCEQMWFFPRPLQTRESNISGHLLATPSPFSCMLLQVPVNGPKFGQKVPKTFSFKSLHVFAPIACRNAQTTSGPELSRKKRHVYDEDKNACQVAKASLFLCTYYQGRGGVVVPPHKWTPSL